MGKKLSTKQSEEIDNGFLQATLTNKQENKNNTLNSILLSLGVSMPKGTIRCCKCHKTMEKPVCSCGHSTCYISIYWRGKPYRFFRYNVDAGLFDFKRAAKQLTEINFAMERKTFNPADFMTSAIEERKVVNKLSEWIEMKTAEADAGELSHETLKNYRGYVNNYFMPFFAKYDVREIRFEQVESFKDSLRTVKAIKTRRNILNALHAFFIWLRRKGVITEMPIWPVIEGENATVRAAIDYGLQIEALRRIPEEHRDPIEFGFETGLRPGETVALKVSDIDLINRQAIIQRTRSGPRIRPTTKGKNKRWIPLSGRAYEIALKHTRSKHPETLLFINSKTGRGYTQKKLNEVWRQYSEHNIDHYSASRHSFCTQIVERGANAFEAQALMRHADIRSTQKYFHATSNRLRDLLTKRAEVINIKDKKAAMD